MLTKEAILNQISNHAPYFKKMGVSEIGLYGSYKHNNQTKNSDIDLLIDFYPKQETFDNYMNVYDYIESLFEGEKIEIATKKGLSMHIGPVILMDVEYAKIN